MSKGKTPADHRVARLAAWARYGAAYIDLKGDDGGHSVVTGGPLSLEQRYANWFEAFGALRAAERASGVLIATTTPHGFFPSAAEAWEDFQRRLV